MIVITEAELREMWQDGRGVIPPMPADVRFTPSARDFLKQWGITVTFTEMTVDDRPQTAEQGGKNSSLATPRFVFRGKMDTLHAQFLLAAAQARRFNLPDLMNHLSALAAYCREITSAGYDEREVAPLQLAGLTEAEIQEASHWPDRILDIAHVTPGFDDHELLLQLNLLRCQVRETELAAASAFTGSDGQSTRLDLILALNRLSSAVYYLILLLKAGKLAWKMPGGLG